MINVKVKNNPVRVSVTAKPSVVTQVKNFASAGSMTLGQLLNVDATDADNGETLVYDETLNKYVIKVLPKIQGGTF